MESTAFTKYVEINTGTCYLNMEHNVPESLVFTITMDPDNYYEKYGWIRVENGIDLFSGKPSRIYYQEL
ncbi:MAG: hypothetical protein DRP86_02440 [Candidatus Neomarinimicrobiota bacterium]|nr:MAG: hypothetical protein DRP86_02440 [Candidatus Neomarinimicrobiota bacterium]